MDIFIPMRYSEKGHEQYRGGPYSKRRTSLFMQILLLKQFSSVFMLYLSTIPDHRAQRLGGEEGRGKRALSFSFVSFLLFTTVPWKLTIRRRQRQEPGEKNLEVENLNVPGNEILTFACW